MTIFIVTSKWVMSHRKITLVRSESKYPRDGFSSERRSPGHTYTWAADRVKRRRCSGHLAVFCFVFRLGHICRIQDSVRLTGRACGLVMSDRYRSGTSTGKANFNPGADKQLGEAMGKGEVEAPWRSRHVLGCHWQTGFTITEGKESGRPSQYPIPLSSISARSVLHGEPYI